MNKSESNKIAIELNPRFLVISLVVLAILVGVLGGQVLFNRTGDSRHVVTGQRISLPEAGIALISGVLCPCGRCEDMLNVCSCETAVDIKRTINRLLSENKSEVEIKETLKSKYGLSLFEYAKD